MYTEPQLQKLSEVELLKHWEKDLDTQPDLRLFTGR